MRRVQSCTSALLIFTLCLFFTSMSNAQEVEDESHFTYQSGHNGPENWGTLKPEWGVCKTGKLQSPIDLSNRQRVCVLPDGNLEKTYKIAPAIIKNRGHDIMVEWEGDAGHIVLNGTKYHLKQGHWHTPSEHTINGKKFHMELHMVHTSTTGGIAVVSVLFNLGRPCAFLTHLLDEIKKAHADRVECGPIDPNEVAFEGNKFYRYTGSLTVPPCTEGVIWTVYSGVGTVSREQITALRNAVHDGFEANARPTQA